MMTIPFNLFKAYPPLRALTLSAPRQHGVVLPIAMIMLVILSFAGLYAARNSANFEQFSNNLRTNQVARQAAEVALRYCETLVIDAIDNEGSGFTTTTETQKDPDCVPTDDAPCETETKTKKLMEKIYTTEISDASGGAWNTKANWKSDAANLIEVDPNYSATVKAGSQIVSESKVKPACLIQTMTNDRYLVTARGLSLDAEVNSSDGVLKRGSEVWLQSILAPGAPQFSGTGVQ